MHNLSAALLCLLSKLLSLALNDLFLPMIGELVLLSTGTSANKSFLFKLACFFCACFKSSIRAEFWWQPEPIEWDEKELGMAGGAELVDMYEFNCC
ncbi:hypothetical protein BpHYR1_011210 [Brachionus plicatilis]|uniref:Secreted protein n=1 Tax=Brachionus plicatilis TaxID=10195 RepID=A0A3M7SNU9_BRAPC|nr:hypothetical protein BpHYR1_011210 [Brachionus plicatilis]